MTCHNHATYMLIWPTAYLTHMPHCVSLSHTSYASGINISSHPPFAGYLDILDFSLYPESYESWVIVSHISHNESWWVIWLIWVMLSPLVSMLPPHMCRHIGYLGYIWVIWVIVSHLSHISHNESWWVISLTWVMLSKLVSMLPCSKVFAENLPPKLHL